MLAGRRVLLIEDDYFIVEDMVLQLEAGGVEVIGPVASVNAALDLIDQTKCIDGAVLDVNLNDVLSWPLADVLLQRGIPFVFATGYDEAVIPASYAHIVLFEKPVNVEKIGRALFG